MSDREKLNKFLDRYDFLSNETGEILHVPENGKNTLFCSFTYLTPNYYTLRVFKEIARFSKNDFNIYLIQWDINAISTDYFKKTLPKTLDGLSPKKFMQEKEEEIKNILESFGGDLENIEIINSSELWRRFIQIEEHNLFLNYFRVVSELEGNESRHQMNHLLQMPLEIFFINYFDEICTEFSPESIDFVLAVRDRRELYLNIREIMAEEGYLSNSRPILLGLRKMPFYNDKGYMPTWSMNMNRIIEIITNSGCDIEDLEKISHSLKYYLDSIYYVKNNQRHTCSLEEIPEIVEKLNKTEMIESVARNMYKFCIKCKKEYEEFEGTETTENRLLVSEKEDITNLGKILRSKRMLEILDAIDGEKSLSEIANEVEIQLSNASNYISKLESAGLVKTTKDNRIKKDLKSISIDISNL